MKVYVKGLIMYVRKKGKGGKRYLEGELRRYMYLKRWEIEWFVERLKLRMKLASVNRKTLTSQITYMLIGMQLTILIETLIQFPKLFRLLVN
ncbi:MAG: hypothetical protein J7K69_02500 [Thermotogae bacterium]|nr:hypothetical protein [Thermotogota bacterium]